MSQNSQGAFGLATLMAIGTFLVAFACLWSLGDFSFVPAFFLAAVIAAIVWLVLYIGMGSGSGAARSSSSSEKPASSATQETTAAPVAAAAGTTARDPSAEAAEAKRLADAEAAERAKADAARRQAEAAEAQEAKRKSDEAAADAKRREEEAAAEAKRQEAEAAEKAKAEADAAQKASDDAAAARAEAEKTPDYDGDGVHEGTNEGTRPEGLDAPRDGKADDLKQIKGIGAKMEALCNRLGFWHFDQIAAWSADEVAWVDANLEGFKGRVTRDTWVEQARVLASGGETEFSKRVEDGDVY